MLMLLKIVAHATAPNPNPKQSKAKQQASVIDARQLRSIIHGRMPKTLVPRTSGHPAATEGRRQQGAANKGKGPAGCRAGRP